MSIRPSEPDDLLRRMVSANRLVSKIQLPPRTVLAWLIALALVGVACHSADRDSGRQTYAFRGPTMGTYYAVKVVADKLSTERLTRLQEVIEAELEDVNAKMSTYVSDSELSRFNRHTETTPFTVSDSTLAVVSEALEIARITGGALDVTIGPLVNAWGFGPEDSVAGLQRGEIIELLERVGFDQLEVDFDSGALRKLRADLSCDLSSIAKGYAVDRVAEALGSQGLGDLWVEVGGEVRATGRNGDGLIWRLGVERPRLEPGAVQRIVPLSDAAVATSGDYRNYQERDGVRFSHIIDPRTGWPIRHRLASVTVIHPRCTTADALATGLMVLGPDEGWELAEREDLAVLFLVRDGDDFSEKMTPRFEALARPAADDSTR